MRTRKKGFTLLELMIVVVILGVLALIAVPALLNAVKQSKESVVKGNISAATSTISSRLAIGSAVATSGGGSTDVVTLLNAGAKNPFTGAAAFVAGACGAGEVGITDNGDGTFTVAGCDGDGNSLLSKTIYAPEEATGINL